MEFSWENVLQMIRENISKPAYEMWFKSTNAKLNGNTLTVIASNSFAKDWLETHYGEMILEAIKEVLGKPYDVIFTSNDYVKNVDVKDNSSTSDSKLITKQQEKIDELEKRIQVLEQKL